MTDEEMRRIVKASAEEAIRQVKAHLADWQRDIEVYGKVQPDRPALEDWVSYRKDLEEAIRQSSPTVGQKLLRWLRSLLPRSLSENR